MLTKLRNLPSLARSVRLINTSTQLRAEATKPELTLTFASSGQVFYNNQVVKQVNVPTTTGHVGILAEHVPTLGCLKPGLISVIETDGSSKTFFVSSGTMTVNRDSTMQLLAEEAASLDQLDPQAIRDGITHVQSEINTAKTEKDKWEAKIALEAYEAMSRAVSAN